MHCRKIPKDLVVSKPISRISTTNSLPDESRFSHFLSKTCPIFLTSGPLLHERTTMPTSNPLGNLLTLKQQEQEPKSKLDEVTDAQVCTAIRYLQGDLECIEWMYEKPDPIAFVLGLALLIQLLVCIGTVWFYQ